jgi:hypothetical protein
MATLMPLAPPKPSPLSQRSGLAPIGPTTTPAVLGGGGGGGGAALGGGFGPGGANWYQTGAPGGSPGIGGGAAAATPRGSSGGGAVTNANTAQMSPYLKEQMQRYRDRFSQDNTARAIDQSNLGIADAAALTAADAKAGMSRRGVGGTGTGAAYLTKRVFAPAQREAAGAAASIAMQRQKDLDALVLGGSGIMGAADANNLQNRQLSLEQWKAQAEDERARAAAAQAQENAKLAQQIALAQLAQSAGGAGATRSSYSGGY